MTPPVPPAGAAGRGAGSAADVSTRLRSRARGLGFDAVGIARADVLERDGAALETWLAAGHHAGMAWMERGPEKRGDPRRVLAGCRSVVVLAVNYGPGPLAPPGDPEAARVARYACARDYHKVVGRKARELAAWLATETGAATRAFVDTGPVLERAWAERAGVGWIGKNANLIRRDGGSWLFLAEILSAAALPPDPGPHEDLCGTCTACLTACPTEAIVAPGVVDSNRCISYWTIEHRGAVPREWRSGIGDWLFGCDVCQEVCPWNLRFARPADDELLGGRDDLRRLDPHELLALDEAAFRDRYAGTPLMRAKWQGMRRNACIVLGNRGEARSLPVLIRALADADPIVRGHAAWAAGRIGRADGRASLATALRAETDPCVRDELRAALDACS